MINNVKLNENILTQKLEASGSEEKTVQNEEIEKFKEIIKNKISEDEYAAFEEEDEDTTTKKACCVSSGNIALDILYQKQQAEMNKLARLQKRIANKNKEKARLEARLNNNLNLSDEVKGDINSKISKVEGEISSLNSAISNCESEINNIISSINQVALNAGTSVGGTSSVGAVSSSYTGASLGTISEDLASRLDSKLGSGFAAKCEEVASKLNCNPNDLLAMMYSESGIDPSLVAYNGATGLIMFMPSVLASKGYSSSQVASMSGVQQLDLVYEFLKESKTSVAGLSESDVLDAGTLYSICFLPAFAKQDVLCSASDGSTSLYYNANSGLDIDGNGDISKSDLAKRLQMKYEELNQYF